VEYQAGRLSSMPLGGIIFQEEHMKKNIIIGIFLGAVAGVIDLVPMVLQGLTWDENLSAFFLWVVSGFFIATLRLDLKLIPKGILIAFLCILPSVFIIGWEDPISLLPIVVMNLVLGSLLGYGYSRLMS
jgi:hypothetical protein